MGRGQCDPVAQRALNAKHIDRKGLSLLGPFSLCHAKHVWHNARTTRIKARREVVAALLFVELERQLGPSAPPSKAFEAQARAEPPRSVTRVPEIERNIALGQKLLALRSRVDGNQAFSALRRRDFPDLDSSVVSELMRVARHYGEKPLIWRRLSWRALVELTSTTISETARQALEARIRAGDRIRKPEIRAARGRLPVGQPRRSDRQAQRMGA
jgi:hypothetical protein